VVIYHTMIVITIVQATNIFNMIRYVNNMIRYANISMRWISLLRDIRTEIIIKTDKS